MRNRVVVTGMGVCAPNGIGLKAFGKAMSEGRSGIRFQPKLAELGFSCQVAGEPLVPEAMVPLYFTPLQLRGLNASGLVYGVIAGCDAWTDAGLPIKEQTAPDPGSGVVFGTGILGADKFREAIYKIDAGEVRRLGSTSVIQTMASGISAYLGGILGCGNQVTTNSSACSTGTEAILMAYERIVAGKAERMLAGSCSDSGPYIWGGFDAMRILPYAYNLEPARASRPMSATAQGFVPGSGAGALVLESLEAAIDRKAPIYAEILGGFVNSGAQRGTGSMTAANRDAVQRCIREAIRDADIHSNDIDCISGHLTGTGRDSGEIADWAIALDRSDNGFPYVSAPKSLIGHCLAAAGSIECVAALLQMDRGQIFGNANCGDLHPEIASLVAPERIPNKTLAFRPKITAKASFGFGDVNTCIIFKAFEPGT